MFKLPEKNELTKKKMMVAIDTFALKKNAPHWPVLTGNRKMWEFNNYWTTVLIAYSDIVKVSCLPRLFSKRVGGLISIIQMIPSATAKQSIKLTNTPDQIPADVNPMQSYESLNRLPATSSCT